MFDVVVALQLNESLAVQIAANVQSIQVAIVHSRIVEREHLFTCRVLVDHMHRAVLDKRTNQMRLVLVVVMGAEKNTIGLCGAKDETDVLEHGLLVVIEVVVHQDVGRSRETYVAEGDGTGWSGRCRRW